MDRCLGSRFWVLGPVNDRWTVKSLVRDSCSMGTTGTIMGTSRFLKEKNPDVRIIGLQPEEGASIPGVGAQ